MTSGSPACSSPCYRDEARRRGRTNRPTIASAPVTTALPIARRAKWRSSASSSMRRASNTRNMAARNAAQHTASRPTRIGVGPTQPRRRGRRGAGVHAAGRDGAEAGAQEERRQHRRQREHAAERGGGRPSSRIASRNTNPHPRSTIPAAARASGTNSVDVIAANAARERRSTARPARRSARRCWPPRPASSRGRSARAAARRAARRPR